MNGRENTYVKQRAGAPSGFFATEAAGLRWLAAASADGGVDVVEVLDQDATSVTLERLDEARPSDGVDAAAARFGAALAATHAAGAPTFGALPPGASTYFFGPLDQPLTLPHVESATFGAFYTQARLRPVLERTRLAGRDADLAQRVCGAVESGAVDTSGAPRVSSCGPPAYTATCGAATSCGRAAAPSSSTPRRAGTTRSRTSRC